MPEKRDIFVSYSRANTEFARDLYAKLQSRGFTLWRDRSDMEGGENWWEQIKEAIENVDTLLLVISPKALESSVVTDEWRYARALGKRVIPVLAEPIDFSKAPRWLRKNDAMDFRYAKGFRRRGFLGMGGHDREHTLRWEKLIHQLKTPYEPRRVPFNVPKLEIFIMREREYNALIDCLLDRKSRSPVAITTALQGGGGFGKTTLAQAIGYDPEVRDAFDDGILWLTVGETPNAISLINELIELITGKPSSYASLSAAQTRLRELTDKRNMLVILDDIWDDHVPRDVMSALSESCACLLTTRRPDVAARLKAQAPLSVNEMTNAEATQLLIRWLPDKPSDLSAVSQMAAKLGEWPLLLELAGAYLRALVMVDGLPLDEALAQAERRLREKGFTAFDKASRENAQQRNAAIAASMAVSIERLGNLRERFLELGIFAEDARIPFEAAARLWRATSGMSLEQAEEALSAMHRLSLFVRYDARSRAFRLHDVIRAYAREQIADLPSLHQKLLRAYEVEHWAELPQDEPYLWDHLAYHLLETNKRDELRDLLLNYRYLQAKLNARDTNALLTDCQTFLADGADEAIRLLRSALSMSAHILEENKCALACQLVGRLMTYRHIPEIQRLLEAAQPPSKTLFQANWDTDYATHEQAGGAIVRTLRGHMGSVDAAAWSPDGSRLVSASADNTLIIWDTNTGKVYHTLREHTEAVTAAAWSPDGSRLVSASADKTLIIWDAAMGQMRMILRGHAEVVTAVAWSPNGHCLASASLDGALIVWDTKTWQKQRIMRKHKGSVTAVAWSPCGSRLVSASGETLIIWDVATGKKRLYLDKHTDWINAVAWSPDGSYLVSGSADTTLIIWNAETGEVRQTLRGHADSVYSVAWSADGLRLASGSLDKTLIIWDAATGAVRQTLRGHTDWVNAVTWSPDSSLLVSASADQKLIIWDTETGRTQQTLRGHTDCVNAVAWSQDGLHLASGSADGKLIIWDATMCRVRLALEGHTKSVTAVAWSSDGSRLFSVSSDDRLFVWNTATGEVRQNLQEHRLSVNAITWSPNGSRLISISADRTLVVWDTETGERLHTFYGDAPFKAVVWSPDGQHIAAGDDAGRVLFLKWIE